MTFKSTSLLHGMKAAIENASPVQRKEVLKANAVFQFDIKNALKEEITWVMDLKNGGHVTQGKPSPTVKPDIVVYLEDSTFVDLASGKMTGQKAFMAGKIKVKGNMMLATRLDNILKLVPKPSTPAPSTNQKTSSAPLQIIHGVESSAVLSQIHASFTSMPNNNRSNIVVKTKAVFQLNIRSTGDKTNIYTLDLKNGAGDVYVGECNNGKPEITIAIADKDFVDLASGKLTGQKAFMQGKLKIKGNMILATKLDSILKQIQKTPKL